MAEFNPLAARRYHEFVRRLLGEDLELPSVSPEVSLEVPLEMADAPENLVLRGIKPWIARAFSGAVAAVFSHAGIALPLGTGKCSVVRGVYINSVATNLLSLSTLQGTPAVTFGRDMGRSTTLPTTQVVTFTNAAQLGSIVGAVTGGNLWIPVDIILSTQTGAAGNAFLVVANAVNVGVDATFWGYERALRPEEQTGTLG